jgi:hypothetical protein
VHRHPVAVSHTAMKIDIGGHIITAKPEITDEARDVLGQLPPVNGPGH